MQFNQLLHQDPAGSFRRDDGLVDAEPNPTERDVSGVTSDRKQKDARYGVDLRDCDVTAYDLVDIGDPSQRRIWIRCNAYCQDKLCC